MIEISWREFLKTGHIQSLKKGISRTRVQEILGRPLDWDSESERWEDAKIWKYHDIQLWFSEHVLTYIGLYPKETITLPSNVNLVGVFPKSDTTFDEVKQFLDAEKLDYKVDRQYSLKITVQNKVDITFYDEDTLYSVATIFP